jgi:hypothetical protein
MGSEKRVVVDNSLIKDGVCTTRLALRHILHRRPKVAGLPLTRGSMLHIAIASWIEGASIDDVVADFKGSYRPVFEAAVEGGLASADDPWSWQPTARILRHTLERWEEKPLPYVGEPGMVEVAVVKRDIIPGVDYVALLDWIVRSSTGSRWLLDWKTKKSLTPWFGGQQQLSAQYLGQVACANASGEEVSGAIAVGLEFGKLNSSTKRCPKHALPYAECALEHVNPPKVVTIQPTPVALETWEATAVKLAKKFVRLKERVTSIDDIDDLPMEGRFYDACNFCDFKEYCALGRPANWLTRMTVEETWDPLVEARKRAGRKGKEVGDAAVHAV